MSGDVARLRAGTSTDREEINKILNALQEQNPKSERDALKEFIAFSPVVRLRTTTVTTGSANTLDTDTRNRETQLMKRKKPLTINSYPLIHTTTGSISWKAAGHKLAGNGIFSGSSYVTVTDQARLNITDEISIALWIKPAAATADGLIISKNSQYQLKLQNSNQIAWRVFSGGVWKTALTYTYTPNTWISIVATYKSTTSGQKLYVNGALVSSDAETGAIGTSANDLKIGGDGTSNLPNSTALAWCAVLHKEVSSTWVTDFHTNNIIDTSGANIEITTIPFVGNEDPKPDAVSGLCRS